VGEGGVVSSNVESGVEVALVANSGALKRTGSISKISGIIETVTSNGGGPTVSTGYGRDKSTERDRTNSMMRHDSTRNIASVTETRTVRL
jgi:hypothetical protein